MGKRKGVDFSRCFKFCFIVISLKSFILFIDLL